MRKPVVDYRNFRLSKINEQEYKHLKYLLVWVSFLTLFVLTENLIPYERCYPVYCKLDDLIPFCEYFLIPYVGWYFLIAGSLIYFMLYSPKSFVDMNKYIIVIQIIAMAIYIIFPTCQELRPETFVRDNIFTDILGALYAIDTNTGVCPSIHVAFSIGIASTWLKEPSVSKIFKILITAFCFLICVSVVFVKQHSVIDIFAAIPLCVVAELVVFCHYKK